jgi:hypothetical protein
LAIEKKTSPERRTDPTPKRSETTQTRSSVARKRVVAGSVAALALVGVGAFFMTRNADGIIPFFGGEKPPALTFDLQKVTIETTTDTKAKDVRDASQSAADQVKAQLEALYYNAFIYQDTWGDPDELDKLFTEDALAKVEEQVDTMTLGKGASDAYDYVSPGKAKVKIEVLTDAQDEPSQAVATTLFVASAEHDDGTFTRITSEGSYFLKRIDGEWRIFAFDVTKKEKPSEDPTTGSPSSKPKSSSSASASVEETP